jgi:hypothetical protein
MDNKGTGSRRGRVLLAVAAGLHLRHATDSDASLGPVLCAPARRKGETEVEEHVAAYAGPGNDEELRQSHEVEFKRGPVIYLNFSDEAEATDAEKRESEESEPEQKSEAPELKMAALSCSGYPTPPPTSRSSWMPSSNSKVLRKR